MRLALVLAAVIALVAGLWFALASPPAEPPPALGPYRVAIEPERPVDAPIDLAASDRVPGVVEPAIGRSTSAQTHRAMPASIVVIVKLPSGNVYRGALAVDLRDPLARAIELAEDPAGVFRASGLAPGEYTISIVGPDCVPLVERIQVRAGELEQRFELRLRAATMLRVRWQTSDGRPFLDVLAESSELVRQVLVRIAVDDAVRGLGDAALSSRRGDLFSGTAGPGQAFGRGLRAWPNAPPDAVSEVSVIRALPVIVCASIDGVVVASAPVGAQTSEIVLRTDLDAWSSRRATVRFCLVDDSARSPVASGRWSGVTRAGASSPLREVGQDGCGINSRLLAASWLFHFEVPGRASIYRELDLAPGTAVDLGELGFVDSGFVVARATLPDGNPAGAVRLALVPVDRFVWGARSEISTDAEGKASFADLATGPHVLVVADSRYTCSARVVEPRSVVGSQIVDVRLELGAEIALDFGPGAALIETAYLHDHAGNPLGVLHLPLSGLVPLRLVPGEYVVELEGAGSPRRFTVTDESVVFDLR